jgi:aminopeptidase YwaD
MALAALQIATLLWVLANPQSSPQNSSAAITADELRAHVKFLASDELEGRASGTEGNRKAAAYIAEQFKEYGLSPAGDDDEYFQHFEFVSDVRLGDDNALAFETEGAPLELPELKVDEDFRPLAFTSNGAVSGPVAFAGYGISAPDKGYDDYENLSVEGKILIVLRYTPEGSSPRGELYRHSSFREKARVARDKGAKGLIIVSGPADDAEDVLVKLRHDRAIASSGLAMISLKRVIAESLFVRYSKDLQVIQDSIRSSKKPITFDLPGVVASMQTDVVQVKSETANIAGYLEGHDPDLKSEVVILGAHMDHLGYGGPGSGSLQPDLHEIHNGADDNASGTAGLLELAQAFASEKDDLKRTMLFISFSGEELGTLGSTYYVNHPFFPLDRSVAMINMDMIGRLDNNKLTIGGSGTSTLWQRLLPMYNQDSTFTLSLDPSGIGPSDHSQFYSKDIPVLFFFTGEHSDYHKPSDDWDRLNYTGEARIVQYVYKIAEDIESENSRPVFARVDTPPPMGGHGDSRGFTVTLGIIPDYGQSSEGMKISTIRPNGPAEKAGLKAGDIIIEMAGKKVMNIYDYMGILGELKVGDNVDVQVIREGKRIKLRAIMQNRR